MSIVILAAALLAAPAPDGPVSAGEVYDDCAAYAATPDNAAVDPALKQRCELHANVQMAAIAVTAAAAQVIAEAEGTGEKARLQSCPPESGDARPLLRAFMDYVRRHPESRGLNAYDVFDRAVAEQWPCPR